MHINEQMQNLSKENSQQDAQIQNLETKINAKLQNFTSKSSQKDAQIQNLERNITGKLRNLEDKLKKIETKLNGKQSPSKLYYGQYKMYSPTHTYQQRPRKPPK
jgi:uncharacterized protein (DUF3084 family)